MTMDSDEDETQYTPKGQEIPVPPRSEVFRDLEKVAKSRKRHQNGASRGDQPTD